MEFARVADMATALFGEYLKAGARFKPQDVAKFMILVKLARSMTAEIHDNPVDVAGYAETWDRTLEDLAKLRALVRTSGDTPPAQDPE